MVAAELAAERATPDSLETLGRLLADNDGQQATTPPPTPPQMSASTSAVARASLNPLLPTLLAPLATLIVKGMFESHSTPDAVSRGITAHTNVLRAIKRRDPAAARRAMAAHLRESRQVFPEQLVKSQNGTRRSLPRRAARAATKKVTK